MFTVLLCVGLCCVCWLFVFVAGSNPFVSTSRSSSSRKSVPIPGHTTSRVQRERGTKVCGLVYIQLCAHCIYMCVSVCKGGFYIIYSVCEREILVQSISQNCVVSV